MGILAAYTLIELVYTNYIQTPPRRMTWDTPFRTITCGM